MTETSGNRSLMLGRFYNPSDRLISRRTFAAAKIDLAVRGERIAIVTIGSGVGGRGMTGDQMIDRKRVLESAQTVFQRVTCTHVCWLRWSMLVREPTTRRSPNATARSKRESLVQSVPLVVASRIAFCKSQTSAGIRDRTAYRSFVAVTKLPELP